MVAENSGGREDSSEEMGQWMWVGAATWESGGVGTVRVEIKMAFGAMFTMIFLCHIQCWSLETGAQSQMQDLSQRYKFGGHQHIRSQKPNLQDSFILLSPALVPTLPKSEHTGTSESPADHSQNMKNLERHPQSSLHLMVLPFLFFLLWLLHDGEALPPRWPPPRDPGRQDSAFSPHLHLPGGFLLTQVHVVRILGPFPDLYPSMFMSVNCNNIPSPLLQA